MQGMTINRPVFFGATAIIFATVIVGVAVPAQAESLFRSLQGWVLGRFGWFYLLSVAVFLVFERPLLGLMRGRRTSLPPATGARRPVQERRA